VGGTSEKSASGPTGECTLTDVMIQLCKAEGFPQITARKERNRKQIHYQQHNGEEKKSNNKHTSLEPPRSTFQLPKDSFFNFNNNCLNRHLTRWKFKRSTKSPKCTKKLSNHEDIAADTT